MPEPRRELEQRFETALVSVLTLDHDLEMRHADALERRSATAAELSFSYQHRSATSRAKAIVTVEGLTNFACVMDVDFASQEAIERSAERCEALARLLARHLSTVRERHYSDATGGRVPFGRREDDLA